MQLSKAARAHLVGINGAGLSSLAAFLLECGIYVSGSDLRTNSLTQPLRKLGVRVSTGHDSSLVDFEAGFVVQSAAIPADNPELVQARQRGLPVLKYSQVLGEITRERPTFAIAGTHGKTSTCGLALAAFRGAGLDPGYILGGSVNGDNKLGGCCGTTNQLLVEACEYDCSFLRLTPRAAVVLNVDADHFDCFPARADMFEAFCRFIKRIPSGGLAIVPEGEPVLASLALSRGVRVLTFGVGTGADLRAQELEQERGCIRFQVYFQGKPEVEVQLKVPGRHMMINALAALALAREAGADLQLAANGLADYAGMRRRFEVSRGPNDGVMVSDYAHHPTELMAVLDAGRHAFPKRRLLALFQPHQHSRTRSLFTDFAAVLSCFDFVLLADIYAARDNENDRRLVNSKNLAAEICCRGGNVELVGPAAGALEQVKNRLNPATDALFVLGAGDIDQLVIPLHANL